MRGGRVHSRAYIHREACDFLRSNQIYSMNIPTYLGRYLGVYTMPGTNVNCPGRYGGVMTISIVLGYMQASMWVPT